MIGLAERLVKHLALWIAQGFGLGRIPVAPGTFGSLAGLAWFAVLVSWADPYVFTVGLILSVGLSIWLTALAENLLCEKDPGSVVLDEIVAMPACFLAWAIHFSSQKGYWPGLEIFFNSKRLILTFGVVAAFRLFDVLKPWPVNWSQNLPGGFGVTLDDLLAALYVNVCVVAVCLIKPEWFL